MKRLLIAFAMLLPLVVNTAGAQTTATVTVTWTAPAVDATHSPAVSYILHWRTVGATAWITATPNPTTNTFSLTIPVGVACEAEVAGVDAQGHVGDWSPVSDPYTWKRPSGCGKPVWS
jgi:hypothetical protein